MGLEGGVPGGRRNRKYKSHKTENMPYNLEKQKENQYGCSHTEQRRSGEEREERGGHGVAMDPGSVGLVGYIGGGSQKEFETAGNSCWKETGR
jgi:hypothetical protein